MWLDQPLFENNCFKRGSIISKSWMSDCPCHRSSIWLDKDISYFLVDTISVCFDVLLVFSKFFGACNFYSVVDDISTIMHDACTQVIPVYLLLEVFHSNNFHTACVIAVIFSGITFVVKTSILNMCGKCKILLVSSTFMICLS